MATQITAWADAMTSSVYVVLCVDTEGPCADPENRELLATWEQVDAVIERLFQETFRSRFPDRFGGPLKVGWFFLTWTGFATNPRKRDFGYHRVRDHYLERWGNRLQSIGDEQCWHYHHPPPSGIGNEWGLDWTAGREYEQIISRQILERQWFPVCFRAGGTILDPLSSRWIDAWFPFDFSNRAPVNVPGLVDWSSGVARWTVYHPSPEDFRRPGHGRRLVARCLDLMTGVHALTDDDIGDAFEQARSGHDAILACFEHDYRDIVPRLDDFRARVQSVAARYPEVGWRYAAPVEAVRSCLQIQVEPRLEMEASHHDGLVSVWTSAPLFQSIPWLAVRGEDGRVQHVESGIVRRDATHWTWQPSPDLDWVEAGFAGSTVSGQSAVVLVCREGKFAADFFARPMRVHPIHPRSIWEHSKPFPQSCIARASGSAPENDSVKQAADILEQRLKPGMTVIDVGCAAGHAWRSFAPLGIQYFGIDSYGRGIEIGRQYLEEAGLSPHHLRVLALEDLPVDERYDAVVALNVLYYFPMFHQPLEIMARAARHYLVIRSSFGEHTEIRYLPDVLLEPGFRSMRAYFNVFSRSDVQRFLEAEGFRVTWLPDRRQMEKFGGKPETVGGISLPYEFLFAERVKLPPQEAEILGEHFGEVARAWHERHEGGPNP